MESASPLAELDKRWRSTCKIVLGGDVGGLEGYEKWLSERADPVFYSESSLSKKGVAFGLGEYCDGSSRISFEEMDFGKKAEPLPIDDIKDIDSIIGALRERFSYAGNIILGNSKFIEKSANISDSFFVHGSTHVGDSKYISCSSMARLCDHVFGTAAPGESSFMIRCNDTYHVKRAFELWMSSNSADCYYVFALNNCSDCMFSFNLRGKHRCIGNAELPKEKYLSLKSSLLEQMRSELEGKKKLPSLTGILAKCGDDSSYAKKLAAKPLPNSSSEGSMLSLEEAFSRTTKLLFGSELSGLKKYRGWLLSRIRLGEMRRSSISGAPLFVCNYAKYMQVPASRACTEAESLKIAELMPAASSIEGISFAKAHDFIGKIAFLPLDFHDGTNNNVIECMAYAYSSSILQCSPAVQIKDSAYCLWPRSSEHLFGCNIMFDSAFCIHCYQSLKLNRCFEVDSSRDCSDCYFCHNCENVQSGIFCFNAKNLRYAVGNVEVGREKYLQAKVALMRRIAPALETGKALGLDIFNCLGRKA